MKRVFFYLIVACAFTASCSQSKSTQPIKDDFSLSFLHTQGMDLVNQEGQKVALKGVGLGNWMLPEGYMWRFGANGDRPRRIEALVAKLIGAPAADSFWTVYRHDYITEKDIQKIAELGFNSVRPALNARLFLTEDDDPQFVQEGFDMLDSLVTWCNRHKLYVILDMHGAPGGQTGQNIDDSAFDEPRLFMEAKYEPRLIKLWLKLADTYKNNPTVAGYDLLNEPLPKMTGAADKYKHLLEPLYKRLTAAIRGVDKKHTIILEGADWSNDWSVFSKPFDNNLVYQFHYYCWDAFEKVNSIQGFLEKRKEWNVPLWVGETGEKTDAIHWATIQLLNENNIGWSFWPWKKLDTRKPNNSPISIVLPQGWDSIVSCSKGEIAAPQAWARPVFDQYLKNIKLENCIQNEETINAMLQRVPARVQAENFGGKGLGLSYSVNDTAKCKNYRTSESVKVDYFPSSDGKRSEGQYITLGAHEWITYDFGAQSTLFSKSSIKLKALTANSEVEIWINKNLVESIPVSKLDWEVVALKDITLTHSNNRLELRILKGAVQVDYIDIR